MTQLFTNNASGTLSIVMISEAGPSTVTLQASEGALFPSPTGADFFICTVEDAGGNFEILKCTSRTGDALTCTRAQESTSSQAFATGSRVEIRSTAGTFGEFIQQSGDQMAGELDMNNQILRDPLLTDGEIRNAPIRGTDGGTSNQIIVPTAGGIPTLGGNTILHTGNAAGNYAIESRQIISGVALTGGGTLAANRTLDLDISGLPAIEGNAVAAADGYLLDDGGVMKRVEHSDSGFAVNTVTGTADTLATADMNTFIEYTNAAAVAVTLNTGVGKQGNWVIIYQDGTGQVTVGGSATFRQANGLKTAQQRSVIVLYCIATNEWVVGGDAIA